MKIMIDTNILISAVLFPQGKAAQALYKALNYPYKPIICDYVIDELHRKFKEKFPNKILELEVFLSAVLQTVCVVKTPSVISDEELRIRDPKDRPILRAALNEETDLFLTGDKDFLESSVTDPRILSVSEFLNEKE